MCGIFGWNLSKASERILDADKKKGLAELLSTINDRRGGDSWGYYGYIKGQEDFVLQKGLGKIEPQTEGLLEYSVLMAHCRNATTGEVTVENAHPFQVENIIGAHNGCIYNHDELNTKYNRECKVDSEHIIHHIKNGLELKEIIGYGSVQWINLLESKEKVYLLKQSQSARVAKLLDENENAVGTIWSSLIQEVYTFLDKHNIAYIDFEFKEGPVHYVLDSGFYFDADRKMYFGSDDSVRNVYRFKNYSTNKNSTVYNIYSNNSWVDQLHPKKRTRSSSMDKLLSAAKKLLFSTGEDTNSTDDGSVWFEEENEPIQKDYDSEVDPHRVVDVIVAAGQFGRQIARQILHRVAVAVCDRHHVLLPEHVRGGRGPGGIALGDAPAAVFSIIPLQSAPIGRTGAGHGHRRQVGRVCF